MWASSGEIGNVFASLWVGFDPVISGPLLPEGVRRTHGCRCGFYKPCRTERFLSKPSLSAGIDKSHAGGPKAHDEAHLVRHK